MVNWDDRILEIERKEDSVSPSDLADSDYIGISRQHVSRRLQKLADHGLLKPLGNGVYIITEKGEGYLDGEISTYEDEPDEIPEDDEGGEANGTASPSSLG